MNDSDLFAGDDASDADAPSYQWLDEWLCEYVDGTMDPSLEAVFSEYLAANPDLASHVERLRHTRELLCACGRKPSRDCTASQEARDRVCGQVECDLLRAPRSLLTAAQEHPTLVTAYASSVLLALVLGLWAGATLLAEDPMHQATGTAVAPPAVAEQRVERPPQASRALAPLSDAASSFLPLVGLSSTTLGSTVLGSAALSRDLRPAATGVSPADSLVPGPRASVPAATSSDEPAILHAVHRRLP